MATSARVACGLGSLKRIVSCTILHPQSTRCNISIRTTWTRGFVSQNATNTAANISFLTVKRMSAVAAAVGAGCFAFGYVNERSTVTPRVQADSGEGNSVPKFKIARSIKSNTDDTGLKLTLYQYQTCPFCCKLRNYLDYRGFSYDVVEVNSVWRTQTKWSEYKKVPILVVEGIGPDGYIQLNDSSVVLSILESFLVDRSHSIEELKSFYPVLESKNEKGKTVYDWPNRYFVMYGENKPDGSPEFRNEERKWRQWTDSVLVHTISPNIYRSRSEAVQAFNWFSVAGDWEQQFSAFERKVVIYIGSIAMYFVGKMLIKKYNLKEDVRESLYDACKEWTKAVGKKRVFMGGDRPNMADVSVYGVLTSFEGCEAFQDALDHTDIGKWFYRMRESVSKSDGAIAMSSFKKS